MTPDQSVSAFGRITISPSRICRLGVGTIEPE
jgi:hypothetical protein